MLHVRRLFSGRHRQLIGHPPLKQPENGDLATAEHVRTRQARGAAHERSPWQLFAHASVFDGDPKAGKEVQAGLASRLWVSAVNLAKHAHRAVVHTRRDEHLHGTSRMSRVCHAVGARDRQRPAAALAASSPCAQWTTAAWPNSAAYVAGTSRRFGRPAPPRSQGCRAPMRWGRTWLGAAACRKEKMPRDGARQSKYHARAELAKVHAPGTIAVVRHAKH